MKSEAPLWTKCQLGGALRTSHQALAVAVLGRTMDAWFSRGSRSEGATGPPEGSAKSIPLSSISIKFLSLARSCSSALSPRESQSRQKRMRTLVPSFDSPSFQSNFLPAHGSSGWLHSEDGTWS